MSKTLTLITEVVTGIGMLSDQDLDQVFLSAEQPSELIGVGDLEWNLLREAWESGEFGHKFDAAFEDGRYFLHSADGLRDRHPRLIEWKGPHQPPEHDPLPADLRIDNVFIISCKNLSKILMNPSPMSLFRTALTSDSNTGSDWYAEIARGELQGLYLAAITYLDLRGFPDLPIDLSRPQRDILKKRLERRWPDELSEEVEVFIRAVSERSAQSLEGTLESHRDKERFYWKLLRLHSSPYFIMGRQPSGAMRLRVLTPWDFRRTYEFRDLRVIADTAGQPQVKWEAEIEDLGTSEVRIVSGHIEIRWSHGKFCGAPEAKIYLDTPHEQVCGYLPI